VAFGEIEKFPCQVLAHHYPDTPNWGDMTKFKEWPDADVNVFVGGTPCQSFSVAGLRKGLDDPRGNLMLTYLAIAARYRPRWLVWENVPGVLSSNGGLDCASLLRGMGELGYGFAYRILDAQYFGVAQRRRRVFVVGYLGNWRPAAAVLFERHSLSGHPAPSRKAREGVAANAREGAASSKWPAEISSTLDTTFGTKQGLEDQHVNAGCPMFVPAVKTLVGLQDCNNFSSEITGTIVTREGCAADTAHMVMQPIALAENTIGRKPENGGNGDGFTEEGPMYTLNATGVHGVAQPIPLDMMNIRGRPSDDGRANRIGRGYGEVGDPMFTITKSNHHAVAQPISFDMAQITSKVNGTRVEPGLPVSTLAKGSQMHVAQPIGTDIYNGAITGDVAVPLTNRSDGTGTGPTVMQPTIVHGTQDPCVSDIAFAQGRNNGGENVMVQAMAVRRLTPKECERLQGFPDNYTDIKPKGKATPDGPRYKALGNSMAVPVMAWIGKRIQEVDAICQTQKQ
jgi:DNA (cytosine-5)-methyltransferase 1